MDKNFLTFDTDWCPNWAIEELCDLLIQKNIQSTWFITNDFPLLKEMRTNSLFEVGLHPNFFPGSSHGHEPREVMSFLKNLVPEAKVVRSHSLYSSEKHLQMMADEFGITHDSSIYLHGAEWVVSHKLKYGEGGAEITRVPHFFQDNMYFINQVGSFSLSESFFRTKGLRIFNFHPIHYLLNTDRLDRYNAFKNNVLMKEASSQDIEQYRNRGKGIKTLFFEVLSELQINGSHKISGVN